APYFDPLLRDLEPEALKLGGQVVHRDQIAVRTDGVEPYQAAGNFIEVTDHVLPPLPSLTRRIATGCEPDSRFLRQTNPNLRVTGKRTDALSGKIGGRGFAGCQMRPRRPS